MAKGTSSGLLDEQRTQSVFKHKILDTYLTPFAAMTGSKADDGRVVILDGFAGRGRYPDGRPASAELILQTSRRVPRVVETVLVEKNPPDFHRLAAVVAEYRARGVPCEALPGDVVEHLPTVVAQATGVPLFMFLDPCGANIPFDALAAVLKGPRRSRWPATEVLLNFSADLTRRSAGQLLAGQLDQHALSVMDRTCGGPWWRDVALTAHAASTKGDFEAVSTAVVDEYARCLGTVAGMRHVVVPVRRMPSHQPVYHLVFLSRREHGFWVFADAVAHARQEWLRVLGPPADQDDAAIPYTQVVEDNIAYDQRKARQTVIDNLRRLTGRQRLAHLVNETWNVFAGCYGVATEATVHAAIATLEEAGQIRVHRRTTHVRDWLIAAPDPVWSSPPLAAARPRSARPGPDRPASESARPTA